MITDRIDVFLSRKSQDAHLAKEVYDFLTSKGLQVFDSDHSLLEMGNSDYSRAIDDALAKTNHLIVIGSSVENITSSWVEAEWRFFLNRKRANKTKGNILTVVTKTVAIDDLPPSLQNYEVIPFEQKNQKILPYVMVGHIKTEIVEEKVIEPVVVPVPEKPKTTIKKEVKEVIKPILLKDSLPKNSVTKDEYNKQREDSPKPLIVTVSVLFFFLTIYYFAMRDYKKEESSVVDSVTVDTVSIDTTVPPPPAPRPTPQIDNSTKLIDYSSLFEKPLKSSNEKKSIKTKDYSAFSDTELEQNQKEEEIFTAVDQNAEFPGGMGAFGKFLQTNLKYPINAQRANVQGKVYVQFVVNTDGSIQNVDVLKSVGFGCDEEAVRVIKSVPRWTPAKQSERAVRSRFTIPINFQLSD
jgi:TonB family protein